jgi:hypothetical protein
VDERISRVGQLLSIKQFVPAHPIGRGIEVQADARANPA